MRNRTVGTVILYTYPDYWNSERQMKLDIQNDKYDRQIKKFLVPKEWFRKFIEEEYVMQEEFETIEEFFKEYTYDDTLYVYEEADKLGVIVAEKIITD